MMHTFAGRLCGMHLIAYVLVLVGALNWGLVALGGYIGADLNVVNLIFGGVPALEQIIYLIV